MSARYEALKCWSAPAILADPLGLDKLIEWKLGSIRHRRVGGNWADGPLALTEEQKMQRQFTIELRVDFADSEKLGPLKQVLQQAARHAYATAALISDNPKSTQVAIFSDDFFSGHEEIKLMEDVIQTGLDQTGAATEADQPSAEMLGAME